MYDNTNQSIANIVLHEYKLWLAIFEINTLLMNVMIKIPKVTYIDFLA